MTVLKGIMDAWVHLSIGIAVIMLGNGVQNYLTNTEGRGTKDDEEEEAELPRREKIL